jgi:asparagine synthase (glutamine-hydrolysing)
MNLLTSRIPEAMADYLGRDEYAHLTLIYTHGPVCLLKSDIIRTYPVLYMKNGGSISVSDHLVYDTDQVAGSEELLQIASTGMVYGDNTVYDGIKSLQAGEILLFNGEEITNSRYFSYAYDNPPVWTDPATYRDAGKSFDNFFKSVMQETIDSIPEHGRIVVPLSGGHDSRLLVNYLYRLGYRNVLCYSYGTPWQPAGFPEQEDRIGTRL